MIFRFLFSIVKPTMPFWLWSNFGSALILAGQKMTMNQRNTIDLDQGWDFMQKGITKLKNILEGLPEPQFSSEDYMMIYTYYVKYSYCKHIVSFVGYQYLMSFLYS